MLNYVNVIAQLWHKRSWFADDISESFSLSGSLLWFLSVLCTVWLGCMKDGMCGPASCRPTQLSTHSGTGNDYQPKCSDALQLGSKGGYGSFHLWINVWVAGKTV